MELVVADSCFYIEALRTKRQPFLEMDRLADAVEWATTGMVVLEVCRGLRSPALRDYFSGRYATMIYLPTTNLVWEHAARLAWSLDRKGQTIPAQDLVIAATCLDHGARLLTHDGHFNGIPGLAVAGSLSDLS